MNQISKIAMVSCALLVGSNASHAAEQEGLIGGFNLDEWTFASESEDKKQRIVEFVPAGQKIEAWTELLTMQTLKKPRKPPAIDGLAASSYENLVKQCPGKVTWNVIARDMPTAGGAESMLYEWAVTDCPPEADQHEVARILYGKFNIFRIAYVAKTSSLVQEKRDKWIAELTTAQILRQ